MCFILLLGSRRESAVSRRHGLVGVKVDALGAGDLHHGSMKAGVLNQSDHALGYQGGSVYKHNRCHAQPKGHLHQHLNATYSYVSIITIYYNYHLLLSEGGRASWKLLLPS